MATEADKYLKTLSEEKRKKILEWAAKRIDELNTPVSRIAQVFNTLILEHRDKEIYRKTKVDSLKNKPINALPIPQVAKPPVNITKPAPTASKPAVSIAKPDELPPKIKTDKTIPVYYEKPAENVPPKFLTGVENMSSFKFRASDSYEKMMQKVNYIKAILKNKTINQKKEILKYYEIAISIEKRSNQEYYYGSKNLKNKMYRFYVGRVR